MTHTNIGRDIDTSKMVQIDVDGRTSHIEVIGSTGVGKTTLMTGIFLQDIKQGKAGAYFDPDGDAVHAILKRTTKPEKIYWFDPNTNKFPPINLLWCPDITDPAEVTASASFAMHIFKRIWNITEHTPSLENLLHQSFITLIYNKLTLAQLPDLLVDKVFRAQAITNIHHEHRFTKWFWQEDYSSWTRYLQNERTESTLTRVLKFLTNSFIRRIVEQDSQIDFLEAMKKDYVFLFRMNPKRENGSGGIGEEGVHLLGTLLLAMLLDAAMSRPEGERDFFSLVVDEFHHFATSDFETMLTRLRKYNMAVTLGYQYRDQLPDWLKGAVAQTGNKIVFRVEKDYHVFAPMFARESPPAELRREAIQMITQDPVGYLLRYGHNNQNVKAFIENYLRRLANAIERMSGYVYILKVTLEHPEIYEDNNEYKSNRSQLQYGMQLINQYLVRKMEKAPFLPEKNDVELKIEICSALRAFIGFAPAYLFKFHQINSMRGNIRSGLYTQTDDLSYWYEVELSEKTKQAMLKVLRPDLFLPISQEEAEIQNKIIRTKYHLMFSDDIEYQSSWRFLDLLTDRYKYAQGQLKEGLSTLNMVPHISCVVRAWKNIELFVRFVNILNNTVIALLYSPIMVNSGQYKEVPGTRENPQYTITDMEQELLALDSGIAWCRILEAIPNTSPPKLATKTYKVQLLDPAKLALDATDYPNRFSAIVQKTETTYPATVQTQGGLRKVAEQPPAYQPVSKEPPPQEKQPPVKMPKRKPLDNP